MSEGSLHRKQLQLLTTTTGDYFSDLTVFLCVHPWMLVLHSRAHTCVRAGVRAHPPVCVCTFLGSARELAGAEKSTSVTEETDIDAEDASQAATVTTGTADESILNRGVTDLDATAKTAEPNQPERKVRHLDAMSNIQVWPNGWMEGFDWTKTHCTWEFMGESSCTPFTKAGYRTLIHLQC